MTAYIVRDRESKAIVGMFAAPSLRDLFWVMDEAGNPYAFEYQKVVVGGLFVDLCGREASTWLPVLDDELKAEGGADEFYYPNTAELMELSERLKFLDDDKGWTPVKRGMEQ
jgi:hypothetical protein